MAQTAAAKAAAAKKEADLRTQIEAEVKATLEAEYREKLDLAEANATSVAVQAADPTIEETDPNDVDSRTVHFVEDGLTLLGKVWMRGETLTIGPGSSNWPQLLDRDGANALDLTEVQQVKKWGKRFFAPGPWPYDTSYELDMDAYKITRDGITTFDEKAYTRDREVLESIQQRKKAGANS